MPSSLGSDLVHAMREKFISSARARKHRPDDGGLLIEVLVGMLILVIVFTATTIALSSMADQRVKIEQRDQALSLLTRYEEESRTFRCGYVVDRIDDNLSKIGDGVADLGNKMKSCDFAAKEAGSPVGSNAGDQDFTVSREINEINSERSFHVSIRYWWEIPGSTVHQGSCDDIRDKGTLPVILTRAFKVTWTERGVDRQETLIKRDPAPNDDVVFASGNRKNILVKVDAFTNATERLELVGTVGINRIVDGLMGQPTDCVWYPYITPDGGHWNISGSQSGYVDSSAFDSILPQGSVIP